MTALLCAVMLLSGASALVFETLWFHQAGLALGNSVWASSLVLTGFMGGLAVGSAAAIWKGDRVSSPVRAYALLEVVVAVSGVGLVFLLPSLGTLATPLLRPLTAEPWALNAARLTLGLVAFLVPSTAMGLTLPLLVKALIAADRNFGRVLGRLYGWNTLGAVTGALLAETFLVGAVGIRGSALVAGSLNLLAALVGALIAGSARGPAEAQPNWIATTLAFRGRALWPAAAFLSGFALLALEVVWFRFLLLFVEGSALSFAVMLAVVLTGISLGGLSAAAWLRRTPEAHGYAALVGLASASLCTATYALFPTVVAPFGEGAIRGFGPVLTVSAPLMLPVSLLSGVFFTLAGNALYLESPSAAASTGILTLANTTGAALGALAGGFLLLPRLGMAASFLLLSLLYVAIGVLVTRKGQVRGAVLYPLAGVLAVGLVLFPFEATLRQHLITTAGRFAGARTWRVVGAREGLSETILYVQEYIYGKPSHFRLVTNSLSMSSTAFNGRRYMKLYVYLPVALHPNPERALLISYGVGSTAKALTDTRSFHEIDVVDTSREILEMSAVVFPDSAENPLQDPRVDVHVEDGRYFLETTEKTFDLITAEPPPPYIANVENLYTREYFQLIHDRLREGGFVTYWLPLHALSDQSAKAVIRAFLEVFSDASLWHGWREDVMLVGTRNAKGPVSLEGFERQWRDPQVAAELEAVGFERPEQLGALFIGDATYLEEITRGQPPLVDNYPKRILLGPDPEPGQSQLFQSLADTEAARERFQESPFITQLWPLTLRERTLPYFELQRIINALIDVAGHPLEKNIADLETLLTRSPLEAPILWYMGSTSTVQQMITTLGPQERNLPVWQYHVAAGLVAEHRFEEALDPLRNAEGDPEHALAARVFRIYLLCLLQRQEQAQSLARETYGVYGTGRPLEAWWEFFGDDFGIDPLLESP